MHELRKIKKGEIDKVAQLLADCFFNDPLYIYFFPSEKARKRGAKALFGYELRRSVNFTYVTGDINAVAVYKAPEDKYALVSPGFSVKLFFCVGLKCVIRAVKYLKFCENCKRKYKSDDEYYLSLLAVSAKFQNKGIGKSILNIFRNNVYLETQNEKNAELYINCGFELIDKINISADLTHFVLKRR